ncbi:MAG: zinc ABC transporter substrate-binding protein [Mailhella sp.]|nr:zinc ABC transporter substrate-binding protein [Mailhella sp.]
MRAAALLLLLCLSFCLPAPAQCAERQIFASVYPVWLLLRQVAGGVPGVRVGLVLSAGTGCPHDFALAPQDRMALARADVLVINGLGLEPFPGGGDAMRRLLKPGARVVDASQGVAGLLPSSWTEESAQAMHDGHGHDRDSHRHGRWNPHIFAAPSMMAAMALSLGEQLAALDPANAALIRGNARLCHSRLTDLARECAETGSRVAGRHILAQHDIFSYLARDMGLVIDGFLQAEEGAAPSAHDLLDLARLMRSQGTAAVITEPQYPGRSGTVLAREVGVPCLEIDPVASGPEDAPADYYEQIMRRNLRALEGTLGTR